MRHRALLFVPLALAVIVPGAAADFSILGGTVVIHTNGDPGTTVTPAETSARTYDRCPPGSGFQCPTVYGDAAGAPYRVDAAAGGSALGTDPCDCQGAFVGVEYDGEYVAYPLVFLDGDHASVCRFDGQSYACHSAKATVSPSPDAVIVCAGAAETGSAEVSPSATCDGLLISTSPVCVERASNGFDIVCETSPASPTARP